MSSDQTISPCLWFENQAEEAAKFYVSLFPNSQIDRVMRSALDTSGAKTGAVILVDFTLAGQTYQALNGGPHDKFNDAISLSVSCADQAEVDRYWEALTADGGKPVKCGWLKDKYGVSWQIVPEVLPRLMRDEDPERSRRVMKAMMQMVKLDVDKLRQAHAGPA